MSEQGQCLTRNRSYRRQVFQANIPVPCYWQPEMQICPKFSPKYREIYAYIYISQSLSVYRGSKYTEAYILVPISVRTVPKNNCICTWLKRLSSEINKSASYNSLVMSVVKYVCISTNDHTENQKKINKTKNKQKTNPKKNRIWLITRT